MRILYLIDSLETNYPRDQNYIIRYMMEKGHEVEVVTSKDQRFEIHDSTFFSHAKILRYPSLFRIRRAKIYLHPKMIEKLYRVYDVVHSFTFFTFSSIQAIFAKSSIKVIRTEVGQPNGLNFAKARRGIYSLLVKTYKNSYNYFTVYNQLERRSLELLGFPKERIVILPPMVDFDRFSLLQRDCANDLVSIGVIGRISLEKGIHRIVFIMREVIKNIPDVHCRLKLILAGRMENRDYARRVLAHLRNLLGSSFNYLGEVAPPYEFYKNVDIVIVPSLYETGAITVLEAMAAGKCVIASNIYPINLYISHGLNGFLFDEPFEASRIILSILEGCIDIKSISREAQKYVQKHDYKIICKKLEEAYYHALLK